MKRKIWLLVSRKIYFDRNGRLKINFLCSQNLLKIQRPTEPIKLVQTHSRPAMKRLALNRPYLMTI